MNIRKTLKASASNCDTPKPRQESWSTLYCNYVPLCKQRSMKQGTGNFQRRVLERKSMETLKIFIFNLNIKNSVKKRILPFFINNGLWTDCSTEEFIH